MSSNFSTKSYRPKAAPVFIPIPDDMKKTMHELEQKGHTCIMYNGIIQPKLTWCQKDICTTEEDHKKMIQRHEDQLALIKKLRNEGHKCLVVPESFPARVSWCNQAICVEVNKSK